MRATTHVPICGWWVWRDGGRAGGSTVEQQRREMDGKLRFNFLKWLVPWVGQVDLAAFLDAAGHWVGSAPCLTSLHSGHGGGGGHVHTYPGWTA